MVGAFTQTLSVLWRLKMRAYREALLYCAFDCKEEFGG